MNAILLIEENPEARESTAELLRLAGYSVYTASDGKSGIQLALRHHPDVIISEIDMPQLDGYGILHLIQKQEDLNKTPFIFLTSKTGRNELRKGMEMGADDFITKPFSDVELLKAIERRIKRFEKLKCGVNMQTDMEYFSEIGFESALKDLLKESKENTYKQKQIIFSEGNHPQYLFYLKSGKVKSFKTNEEGKELTVQLYGPGDFLGYIALIEESPYRITAQAFDDCEVQLIPRKEFFDLVRTNSSFALAVIRVLARHNNQKAEQMVQLAYNSLRKRVAGSLLLLKDKFRNYKDSAQPNFIISITREELANLSGTTTESLIRTLSNFRAEKLIDIHGRSIEILDENKLENIVG